MAYDTANPPSLIAQGIGGKGQIWDYRSTDSNTAVDAAGYFSNAQELGMKVGAMVLLTDTDATPPTVSHPMVNEVSANGADLTDGTPLTDSD